MKKDPIYPYYLSYLESRLDDGDISKGSKSLLKISKSAFDDFKYRYENDIIFSNKISDIHKSDSRDKKINDLFDDLN